jgi:integration host factor subunit alpha
MLQFSAPAQAGATAAARINSARTIWMHWMTIDFIPLNYKITAGCMSTGKARRIALLLKQNPKFEARDSKQIRILKTIKSKFVSGKDVLNSGFGKFCVKEKRERRGRNPAAGDSMMLADRRLVVFKCSGRLRDRINKSQ